MTIGHFPNSKHITINFKTLCDNLNKKINKIIFKKFIKMNKITTSNIALTLTDVDNKKVNLSHS